MNVAMKLAMKTATKTAMSAARPDVSLEANSASISDCFALLDDCDATAAAPRSRLYTDYAETLVCWCVADFPSFLERMQQGLHAVVLFSYELGAALHGIAPHSEPLCLARIVLFRRCDYLSQIEVDLWLKERAQSAQAAVLRIRPTVTQAQFSAALARIHAYLEAGDTYQVNYTYRLHCDVYGSVYALYRKLRERQPAPFGALIALPDGSAVLSFSPELFVRHTRRQLTVCPMKGTAAASGVDAQDALTMAALSNDPKNRAENLMIVDLLRNDLSRVAESGSVQAPQLFQVRRYGGVLQMTSTVCAQLRVDATLFQILTALYPCGSITGAPKRRTMQIIRELEPDARGLYTGALGWCDAPTGAETIGDFCLSVPIRTLTLQKTQDGAKYNGVMGVGAGIVFDSDAMAEYRECQLKANFLTGLNASFELLETMYATQRDGCRHIERHLQRLAASAAYFKFNYDELASCAVRALLEQTCNRLPSQHAYRLRLTLNPHGVYDVQVALLQPCASPVQLLLAPQALCADDVFLRHKTTMREQYDAAWRAAEAQQAFDMVFCNTRGEVTEGARSNIFVKLAGCWYTPPLSAGLLPGVMRAVLLDDPHWNAQERKLTLDDLRIADEIVVCNALRGALRATIRWD